MAEEVLGVYQCLVRKLPTTVYITTDRMIMHANGTAIEEAHVILLSSVVGFMLNKPRPGLPESEQKTLIKIQYREAGSTDLSDRVIDFTGDDRFGDILRCEALLKDRAGDKAEERRIKLKQEAERVAAARTQFLSNNPDIAMMFDYLTSVEGGGLSADEFWDQYKDQLLVADSATDSSNPFVSVPAPLRRPDMIQNDVSANILVQSADRKNELNVTPEKAAEIFTQFPKAKELYDQFVPSTMSEKNFWKRFFQSQYFNIAQGHTVHTAAPGTGAKDTIFDSLGADQDVSKIFSQFRPGEVSVNPEIDLSTDWAVAEHSVFTYREDGTDGSQKVETSGKIPTKESVPHSALIRRFNQFSSRSLTASSVPTVDASEAGLATSLKKRLDIVNAEIESEIRESTMHVSVEEPAITRAEIERLRTTRNRLDNVPDWSQFPALDSFAKTAIMPGIEGVASATIELTTELVSPMTSAGGAELSKRMRKLALTDENRQMDDYVDRVCEILRFYFSCKIDEKDKRTKLISTLNKIKNEINNSFIPKAKFATDWTATIAMLNGMVSNVEIINANIS